MSLQFLYKKSLKCILALKKVLWRTPILSKIYQIEVISYLIATTTINQHKYTSECNVYTQHFFPSSFVLCLVLSAKFIPAKLDSYITQFSLISFAPDLLSRMPGLERQCQKDCIPAVLYSILIFST